MKKLIVASLLCMGAVCVPVQSSDSDRGGMMSWSFGNAGDLSCRLIHDFCVCILSSRASFQIVDRKLCIPDNER